MKTIEERAKEYGSKKGDISLSAVYNEALARIYEEGYIAGATEQKAIDEEVRLKKCDDMTQAEYDREVAFADWYHQNGKGTPTYSDAIEWARKAVIEEARDWFSDYLMEIGYPDDWMRDSPNMLSGEERFRKAMEESYDKDKSRMQARS